MPRLRHIAFLALAVALWGSLAATGGHAWYLRSDSYRRVCGAALSESLALPSEIGRVVPRSLQTRQFDDVRVYLPDRRDIALSCEHAIVVNRPAASDPNAYEIELAGGAAEISTRTWLRQDYRLVVESGLRPGFSPDGPRRVVFSNMDVRVARDRFHAELQDASGAVEFMSPTVGHAAAFCHEFNGHTLREPVSLTCTFSPLETGLQIDSLELTVPRLPLATLALGPLLNSDIQSGSFSGRLAYGEAGADRHLSISGRCEELSLAECLAGLFAQPVRGRCAEVELQELRVENRRPTRLRFRGVLNNVVLGDLLAVAGFEAIGGDTTLYVREADFSPAGIDRLIASGRCENASLESISAALGWGRMSGELDLVIDDLTIESNRVASLKAELRVGDGLPKWIEGKLLREVVRRVLAIPLPPVLPERIEYTKLGLRLDVQDEVLNVFGTHGPRNKSILTVRLLERDVALVNEPEQHFQLSEPLDALRQRGTAALGQRLSSGTSASAPTAAGPQAE